MKRTYETPALTTSGEFISKTKLNSGGGGDGGFQQVSVGSVGFAL